MNYHSESIIRTFVLWINRQGKIRLETTSNQIEDAALFRASNSEREIYFKYASFIMSLGTLVMIVVSVPAMIIYLSTGGLNLGLVLFMPALLTMFISNKFTRKANGCNQEEELIEFSNKDLLLSIIKYLVIATMMVSVMMWLAS